MRIRYSKWTRQSGTDAQKLEQMISLFSYLLVQTSGDVDEALEWMKQLGSEYGLFDGSFTPDDFTGILKEKGIIEVAEDVNVLTTRGVQRIREDALREIFTSLRKGDIGSHEVPRTGSGIDRSSDIRKWAPGDAPTNIDLGATLRNTFKREGIEEFSLREEDLEVYETEHLTSCSTVLMLDISHSMILYGEDRITPAKQVALALSELIMRKFPKDYLSLVVFGDDARLMSLNELPFLSVGPYHTNTLAGLRMARMLLRRRRGGNNQIFMVTDGKPSAIFDDSGRLYKNSFGLDPRIVNKTLDEALACRKEQIKISTFMVARDPYLVNFVEELTRANQGRAYYSRPDRLGEFLFVDYIRNRKKRFGSS